MCPGFSIPNGFIYLLIDFCLFFDIPGFGDPAFRIFYAFWVLVILCSGFHYSCILGLSIPAFRHSGVPALRRSGVPAFQRSSVLRFSTTRVLFNNFTAKQQIFSIVIMMLLFVTLFTCAFAHE